MEFTGNRENIFSHIWEIRQRRKKYTKVRVTKSMEWTGEIKKVCGNKQGRPFMKE